MIINGLTTKIPMGENAMSYQTINGPGHGHKIECKGRNGYFKFHKGAIMRNNITDPDGDSIDISMRSKSPMTRHSPVHILGPRSEVIALLEEMLRCAKRA
jgi:hypothetical protein